MNEAELLKMLCDRIDRGNMTLLRLRREAACARQLLGWLVALLAAGLVVLLAA